MAWNCFSIVVTAVIFSAIYWFPESLRKKRYTMGAKYSVSLIWIEEDQAYLASVPELRGCIADGATRLETMQNLELIISEWLETQNTRITIDKHNGRPIGSAKKYFLQKREYQRELERQRKERVHGVPDKEPVPSPVLEININVKKDGDWWCAFAGGFGSLGAIRSL